MSTPDENLKQAQQHQQAGLALAHQGRLDEAIAAYRAALALRPDYVAAYGNLGHVLRKQGKLDEAAACYRRITELAPTRAEAYSDLGTIFQQQREFDLAAEHYRRAIELRPEFAQAHHNLGDLLASQLKLDEAAQSFRRAVSLQQDMVETHNSLGAVLNEARQWSEAEACFRRALALRPDYADAHSNLATVLMSTERPAEAEREFREAIRLDHQSAEAWNNLGNLLSGLDRFEEALASYARAVAIQPDYSAGHCNYAFALLRVGRLTEGWEEYFWLWDQKPKLQAELQAALRPLRGPEHSLAGKTVLLRSDYGLGDNVQFVRYAELLQQRGARVIVQCPAMLVELLASCPGVDRVVADGESPGAFDLAVPIPALPAIFRTTLDTLPCQIPYLAPRAELVEHWRQEIPANGCFRIGIAWHGNPRHHNDAARSIPLTKFAPLVRLPGVQIYSLQMGQGSEQLQSLERSTGVVDLSHRGQGYEHTAAIMRNLELVITADSSPAHVAGALGVPVWVASPRAGDWRWMIEREDSPWYPTMRLFHQRRDGDWDEVFGRIEAALVEHLKQRELAGGSRVDAG